MTNNNVFKKICIANHLRHFEIMEIFELGGFELSSSSIKAYMAGGKNKNYEKLSDELMEAFLNGFIIYSRGSLDDPTLLPRSVENTIIRMIEERNVDALEEVRSMVDGGLENLGDGKD